MHLSGYQAYTTSLVNSLQHLPCMAIGSDSLLTTSHRIFFGLSFKSYSFHFIIHAFSPSHSCPLLKHIHILSTYFATQVLLYNLFLVFLSNINLPLTLTVHIYLIFLILSCQSAIAFLFFNGQLLTPYNTQPTGQLTQKRSRKFHTDKFHILYLRGSGASRQPASQA